MKIVEREANKGGGWEIEIVVNKQCWCYFILWFVLLYYPAVTEVWRESSYK